MNDAIVEEVLRRVQAQWNQKPAALLLGDAPREETGYRYVQEGPYEAVVIGSLDAMELLQCPNGVCLQALLEGKAVYLWEAGERWRQYQKTAPRELYALLLEARRRLLRLGVRPLRREAEQLITAAELRRRQKEGLPISGRLTPLARDLLEGKEL